MYYVTINKYILISDEIQVFILNDCLDHIEYIISIEIFLY